MVLALALGFLLVSRPVQTGFSHTPGAADTVRYNRDDFGVLLHVPEGWKGAPVLLFLGPKDSVRTAPSVALDGKTYRARFRANGELRYAFWVDPSRYKPGATGLTYDQSGLHSSAAPAWFDQTAVQYPEVKPPHWPGEGAVFYALDTDRFGDGSSAETGAQGFTKHLDYVQGLGVNAIWLNAVHVDSGDTIEDAHGIDWHVVAEAGTPPKAVDGMAAPTPPATKGWRIALADDDAHELLQSSGSDGVLDRRWDRLIYSFVRDPKIVPSTLASGFQNLRADYPDAIADQMILRLSGPGRPRPSAVFRADRKRLMQIWILLLTLPGVPVIDAGDEIGLLDTDAPMQWNPTLQDSALLDIVKKLVLARTTRPSLYRGEYRPLDLDDETHVFGFSRLDRRESTIVLINNSDESQAVHVPVAQFGSADLRDLYGNMSFGVNGTTISLTLPAHGFAVIGS